MCTYVSGVQRSGLFVTRRVLPVCSKTKKMCTRVSIFQPFHCLTIVRCSDDQKGVLISSGINVVNQCRGVRLCVVVRGCCHCFVACGLRVAGAFAVMSLTKAHWRLSIPNPASTCRVLSDGAARHVLRIVEKRKVASSETSTSNNLTRGSCIRLQELHMCACLNQELSRAFHGIRRWCLDGSCLLGKQLLLNVSHSAFFGHCRLFIQA